jgi:hypothetical protein
MGKLGTLIVTIAFTASCIGTLSAQMLNVKIVHREDRETGYRYVVPAQFNASSSESASCNGSFGNVNCSGSSRTNAYSTGPREIAYSVVGATFSLLLPDGRLAVVNCVSKYRPRGDHINRRSCRAPLVDEIQAEFNGKKAKLIWPVSLDGKKMESETYTILAVLAPTAETQPQQ